MRSPNTYITSLKLSSYTVLIAKHPVLVCAVMTSLILMQQRESFKSTALMHISTQLTLSFPHAAVLIGRSITIPASIFFFAIFCLHPQWDWNALPQPYLASPPFSLDTDLLIPTSQMTPASRFVNLHGMKTWVWEINKCKHRKMTVQTWTSTQENFQ